MLTFNKNIKLKNSSLSTMIINFFNEKNNSQTYLEEITNYFVEITGIKDFKKNEDFLEIDNSIADFKKENFEKPDNYDYIKLNYALGIFESRILYFKSNLKAYKEIPLSAYQYIGNNKTKFSKSYKLTSLIYGQ